MGLDHRSVARGAPQPRPRCTVKNPRGPWADGSETGPFCRRPFPLRGGQVESPGCPRSCAALDSTLTSHSVALKCPSLGIQVPAPGPPPGAAARVSGRRSLRQRGKELMGTSPGLEGKCWALSGQCPALWGQRGRAGMCGQGCCVGEPKALHLPAQQLRGHAHRAQGPPVFAWCLHLEGHTPTLGGPLPIPALLCPRGSDSALLGPWHVRLHALG